MPLTQETLLSLQNGSDVRGVAIAAQKPVNLSGTAVLAIAQSFALWLAKKCGKTPQQLKIGVGHDSRLTAKPLLSAALSGIGKAGAAAFDCALASTPAMFMATVFAQSDFDGAIMLTASHLPFDRNGMKFFTKNGGLEKQDITQILQAAAAPMPTLSAPEPKPFDLMALYCRHIRAVIKKETGGGEQPLCGLHIVVDAGNGAGGFYATEILAPLGADISGSLFLEPNGEFPNHQPNPENAAAMAAISSAARQHSADLGLIFDTDVDRVGAVLPDGRPLSRDALIAMAAALLAKSHPNATIVTDSVTSDRLTDFLENRLKLRHHRFKRGYKNVINEAIRLEKENISAPLAIETSGHAALQENYFLDDGAYLAAKLVIACQNAKQNGKTLSALIEGFADAVEEQEVRLPVLASDFADYAETVLAAFEKNAKAQGLLVAPNSFEGVRITTPDGWLLLRRSLHDPLLPLNLEGTRHGGCAALLQMVRQLLTGFDQLDYTALKQERNIDNEQAN